MARHPLNLPVAIARVIASLTGPDRTIVGASIRDRDITGPDDIELGTVANGAGLCRAVSANHIGDIRSRSKRGMGLGFWIGLGAAQATARAKGVKPTHLPRRIISILLGILLALLIAAGLLMVFWANSQ